MPLLFNEPMSLVGLVTLYSTAAIAAKAALRWRFSKAYYHQLLLTYQHANRLGTSDGALVYLARLAEAEQTPRSPVEPRLPSGLGPRRPARHGLFACWRTRGRPAPRNRTTAPPGQRGRRRVGLSAPQRQKSRPA